MNSPAVLYVSECFIKPLYNSEESKQPEQIYLAPWDLVMVSVHYIQRGLLFTKPPDFDKTNQMKDFLRMLKDSLSLTLVHFYPLAGRLATLQNENRPTYSIYVDCTNSPGARFIHASLELTINEILSPTDVPEIVKSFFDHDKAINHDGHTLSLLTIQVTELIDGIFIGCSMNHMIGDGTSYWHFFNTWSEIFKAKGQNITVSRPPIHERLIPEGHGPVLSLGSYDHPDQFIFRYETPKMRERIFHLSSEALEKLKAKANAECNTTEISSLQALSAHVWRCVTRARNLPPDQKTSCRMAANMRARLNPPVSENYFGNYLLAVVATSTSAELLGHELGWAAWQLHQAVVNHTDKVAREWIQSWVESPFIYQLSMFDPFSIMMGSSPHFNMYGNEFGLGTAIAIRGGSANKTDGKVSLYPGKEGDGSMDLELCLSPHLMSSLESDQKFMKIVSVSSPL